MHILPLSTPLLRPGDSLARIMTEQVRLLPNDIVVVSSKAVATTEGNTQRLDDATVTADARSWSERTGLRPAFCQAVLAEMERMHGHVVSWCPGALLTELRPDGFHGETILVANAGLDQSNVEEGYAIGWPRDPVRSIGALRKELEKLITMQRTQRKDNSNSFASPASSASSVGIILSDSSCMPRRRGVTAIALTVSGIDPVHSQIGKPDLFGKVLRITHEATADQVATAANIVMGNAGQSTPAAVIRDHGIELSEYEGWVAGIDRDNDLFRGLSDA